MDTKEKEFLIGLEKLTRKTGIKIWGCGCCSSPSLEKAKITSKDSGYGFGYMKEVSWIDRSDEFDWGNCSNSIVKE